MRVLTNVPVWLLQQAVVNIRFKCHLSMKTYSFIHNHHCSIKSIDEHQLTTKIGLTNNSVKLQNSTTNIVNK